MKNAYYFLAMVLLSTAIWAQDYQIDFAVSGDSEAVADSVVVHNIEQGSSITIQGNDILHLVASATGIADLNTTNNKVEVYPNPFSNSTTIVFQNDKQGPVRLSLFDMTGCIVSQNGIFQPAGKTFAEVRGLPAGAYLIQIETETSLCCEVILSNSASGNTPEIVFTGSGADKASPITALKSSDRTSELVDMQYNEGDTLFLTGFLGNLKSKIKIVPVESTTISFDFREKLEDISATDTITINGGVLQVADESGNMIILTIPPGAVMDSSVVSLTLSGEQDDLPLDERQLRTFKIRPLDIYLYEPAMITIEYNSPVSEIEKSALFQVQSENWLIPLSDHTYADDHMSITASTLHFGDFTEGKMTLEQVNTQFDLLVSSLGITWTATAKSAVQENRASADGSSHKETWDGWKTMAGGFVTFFNLKYENGFYDNGENNLQEDQEKLCEKVMDIAVKEVLDKPLPDDLCDRDYTHTLASMVHDMNLLGCEGSSEYARLKDRFDQTLINCASYLDIDLDVNVESGGYHMLTSGVVYVNTTTHMSNHATVEGTGKLSVSGNADAGGECTGLLSGETDVDVAGNRDAAYTFTLTLNTYQNAVLTTICPDGSSQTPLLGDGVLEISLGPANDFSYIKEEAIEGGGTYMIDIRLKNPYISLPPKD